MLAEKPSSSHFQFTGHILRSTFNHLFTQESVDTDTIRHLSASRRGKNDYHDKYVERLLQVSFLNCSEVVFLYYNKLYSS